MASTHESGGFPGGANEVTSGDQCAQLYAAPSGSTFGIFADTREDKNGLSGQEKCGRVTIPGDQNSGVFRKFPAPSWWMLDNDAFYLSNPGFEHCTSTTACAWKQVG
ncbi:hypothetical protein ACFYWO_34800 [Streptomyces sp. NPDC002932]|uniref:hypothetical protein n=1 Tax=Streptomyces sp. NPDC002932 TaxID=3364672 RepID=UPI0036BF8E50